MTETLLDSSLDGIEWSKFERDKSRVVRIRHGEDGISLIDLAYQDEPYLVALDTSHLDWDEVERVCREVPEWWRPEGHWTYKLYHLDGEPVEDNPAA